MQLPPLIEATFVHRPNRFTAGVRLADGGVSRAYVPNTGRLTGALHPGGRVWLAPAEDPARKTPYTLVLTELPGGGLCSVNASLANDLFAEAVQDGALAKFPFSGAAREVQVGRSRLDFKLSSGDKICWVEVKSVTYVKDGVGMFPDAPTARGRRHLQELAKLAARGDRACAVFVAQREDAEKFMPFEAVDPDFTEILRQVHDAGVEVIAYRCDVSLEAVTITEEIPVNL